MSRDTEKLAEAEVLRQVYHTKTSQAAAAADTFDREYQDRLELGLGGASFWQRRGLATLQDWALFLFYVSYGLVFLMVFLYTMKFSKTRGRAAVVLLAVFAILGVMITGILLRFG